MRTLNLRIFMQEPHFSVVNLVMVLFSRTYLRNIYEFYNTAIVWEYERKRLRKCLYIGLLNREQHIFYNYLFKTALIIT